MTFQGNVDRFDSLRDFILEVVPLPPVGEALVDPSSSVLGIRQGQTIRVGHDDVVPDNFNAGRDSKVFVESGGNVGRNFEAVGAEVSISGGTVGDQFDAYVGSTVTIAGGEIGDNFDAYDGSRVTISGGLVGCDFNAHRGSEVTISGGTIESTDCGLNGEIQLFRGSKLEIVGSEFFGGSIEGLAEPGDSIIFDDLGHPVTGTFSDGTSFEMDISSDSRFSDGPDAILRLTIAVPEPLARTLALFILLAATAFRGCLTSPRTSDNG